MSKILISYQFEDQYKSQIQDTFPEHDFLFTKHQVDEYKSHFSDCEYFIGYFVDVDLFAENKNLKRIHFLSAGVDHCLDKVKQLDPKIQLSASKGVSAVGISEMIAGYILSFSGRVFEINQVGLEGLDTLEEAEFPRIPLSEQKVLIIGYGTIGRSVASALKGFNCKITGYSRTTKSNDGIADKLINSNLSEELGDADHIISLLPLTSETNHFFDAGLISDFKVGSYFYSFGRSQYVDHNALLEKIRNNQLSGCVLDKIPEDPILSELKSQRNIYITNGLADTTTVKTRMQVDLIIKNIKRYDAGEEPLGKVDRNLEY